MRWFLNTRIPSSVNNHRHLPSLGNSEVPKGSPGDISEQDRTKSGRGYGLLVHTPLKAVRARLGKFGSLPASLLVDHRWTSRCKTRPATAKSFSFYSPTLSRAAALLIQRFNTSKSRSREAAVLPGRAVVVRLQPGREPSASVRRWVPTQMLHQEKCHA